MKSRPERVVTLTLREGQADQSGEAAWENLWQILLHKENLLAGAAAMQTAPGGGKGKGGEE